jgi:hypothetical protein
MGAGRRRPEGETRLGSVAPGVACVKRKLSAQRSASRQEFVELAGPHVVETAPAAAGHEIIRIHVADDERPPGEVVLELRRQRWERVQELRRHARRGRVLVDRHGPGRHLAGVVPLGERVHQQVVVARPAERVAHLLANGRGSAREHVARLGVRAQPGLQRLRQHVLARTDGCLGAGRRRSLARHMLRGLRRLLSVRLSLVDVRLLGGPERLQTRITGGRHGRRRESRRTDARKWRLPRERARALVRG